MKTGFRTLIDNPAGAGSDLGDLFIPRALFSDGGLWGSGGNDYGELGDNTLVKKSSPVQTVSGGNNWKLIGGGRYHNTAIKTDGTLWLWGWNGARQLGEGALNTNDRSSPVQTVAGGTNWKQVSGGGVNTAAIKTDGTLWLWGNNVFGQLGNNQTGTTFSSPVQTVAGGTNWKQVSCGDSHAAAIKTDGTLWLWGDNIHGRLGDNTITSRSSPVQTVSAGNNWKQVSCGNAHTAAIKTDGTLWLWGLGMNGQLGNGTTSRSSPVQTVSAGNNWKMVASSSRSIHTAAIKTDGTLWTWGANDAGELGDNTTTSRNSPVQTVSAGTDWKYVATGAATTAAIKTDGTLWTWGWNDNGQLGDGTTTWRSSPVQTVAGGNNWKQVTCGRFFISAIKDDY